MCEEFGCLPSEALKEWRRWPPGFLEEVIEARDYAPAKRRMEAAMSDQKALAQLKASSPLAALAHEIEMDIVAEGIRAAQHG
jgi:hypothetical protein